MENLRLIHRSDFTGGTKISTAEVNMWIKQMAKELLADETISSRYSRSGNTMVIVRRVNAIADGYDVEVIVCNTGYLSYQYEIIK